MRDRSARSRTGVWLLVAIATISAAATPRRSRAEETIVIGSKSFPENRLLGEIMAQLVEAHSQLRVERRVNLGGSTVVFSALRAGELDVYPEYTGTGWAVHLERRERASDPLRVYLRVADEFKRRYGLVWLKPFGFNNSYALAMDEARAKELGIRTISDLQRHEAQIRAGLSHEFLDRLDGYPGLAKRYGLDLGQLRGVEHGLAYEALRTRRIDVIDTWTTDGKLSRYHVRLLRDDRGFFPPYDCAPLASAAVLARHPELGPLLDRLAFRLDEQRMRALNAKVELEGASFARVAREFLRVEGLLSARAPGRAWKGARAKGFLGFIWSHRAETADRVLEHLWLTLVAVSLAVFVAVPLGVFLARQRRIAPPVLSAAGLIQTVPSLALLALMIPVPGLGLGARSAIAALFLYALLPIVRNTFTGIGEVDGALVEAARGIGLTERQILLRIQLPLAMRTIMAGIRTAAVISIGVATLAAFIGAGGLGDPIVTGLQLNDLNRILSGAIPAALLALITDFALGRAERKLVPRGLRRG